MSRWASSGRRRFGQRLELLSRNGFGRAHLRQDASSAPRPSPRLPSEKWLGHPGNIKDLGDWAFCEGINRFVFHRYAAQPWTECRARHDAWGRGACITSGRRPGGNNPRPGTNIWPAASILLAAGAVRGRHRLSRPGRRAAQFRAPPETELAPHIRSGYDFDGCTPEVVLTRMSVKDGRLVLPDGMSYRVLVLPQVETMTPALLAKIKQLADAGAMIVGPSAPPRKSPSLADMGARRREN